jgi:signal transduction histidine kinase
MTPLPDPLGASYRRAVTPPDASAATGPDAVLPAAVLAAAARGHLETTLHEVVQAAVDHVGAMYGALGVLTPDGRRLDRLVVVGADPHEAERIGRLRVGTIVSGFVDRPTVLRWTDLGSDPESLGFAAGHPARNPFLGVPVRVGGALFGNLYLTERRTGEPFSSADVEVVQALAAVAGLAIENARLAERAEMARRWLQAGTDVATALLSGAEPDEVLRSVAARVATLIGADLAGILVPIAEDTEALVVAAAAGPAADEIEGVRIPLSATHVGRVHRSGLPSLVEDVSADPLVGRHAAAAVEITHGLGPGLMVPFGHGPAIGMGMIVAMRARGREQFDTETLDPLSGFATQTALALELARSQRRERRLQVQADRDRIARDLHDHVVQRIFATGLSLDRLSRSVADELPEVAGRLARSVDELDATIAEIRSAIFELHEDGDTDMPVRSRVTDVVRRVTEGHALQRDLRLRGPIDDLPRELVPDLLAVVRELLTNVVRHAGASRVTLAVEADREVRVVVTDNGRGLPQVIARSGLANLADRAERRGGRLRTSAGPAGTEVCWTIPRPAR